MFKLLIRMTAAALFIFCCCFFNFAQEVTGDWFYYNDAGNKGTSKIIINNKETLAFDFIKEKIGGVEKRIALLAGYVTNDYAYGFLGMGFKISNKILPQLKKAKGIKFKVMGDQKQYRCRLETNNINDYDYYGKIFKAPSTFSEVVIYFSQLSQEGWGQKIGFNSDNIFQISFQTVGQPHESVFLKIWDIELVK